LKKPNPLTRTNNPKLKFVGAYYQNKRRSKWTENW